MLQIAFVINLWRVRGRSRIRCPDISPETESGNTIVITRHNELVAKLIPAHPQQVHRGKDVGKGGIKPALKRGTKLPYLEVLWEDRGDR